MLKSNLIISLIALLVVIIQCESDFIFATNNSHLDLSATFSLESFIHWNVNGHTNPNVKTLKLTLYIHSLENSSAADNQDYYHMSAGRLKKLLPKLERIELRGGHCFFPENGNNAQFKSELNFIAYSIDSIRKACRYENIQVKPLEYKLALVFSKEAILDTNIEENLHKIFGQESTIHSSSNKTHFEVVNDGHNNHLDIQIDILTNVDSIQEKTTLQHGRTNFTIAENEFYKLPGSNFYEQVFIPGKKLVYRTIYSPLYLEEFATKVNLKPQMELEKLTINLLLFPLANETFDTMNEKYDKAVENLRKAAPNLKHIDLMGGHMIMKNGTSTDIEDELNMLKNGLDAVVQAFSNHNLTLHSVIMQIFMVFPEEAFTSMNYSAKINELFTGNITSFPNLTLIDQSAPNNVEIQLELSTSSDFQTIRKMTKLKDGYSEDFTLASLFSSLDMGFIKRDVHLND